MAATQKGKFRVRGAIAAANVHNYDRFDHSFKLSPVPVGSSTFLGIFQIIEVRIRRFAIKIFWGRLEGKEDFSNISGIFNESLKITTIFLILF